MRMKLCIMKENNYRNKILFEIFILITLNFNNNAQAFQSCEPCRISTIFFGKYRLELMLY